jgi:hypothetical protein
MSEHRLPLRTMLLLIQLNKDTNENIQPLTAISRMPSVSMEKRKSLRTSQKMLMNMLDSEDIEPNTPISHIPPSESLSDGHSLFLLLSSIQEVCYTCTWINIWKDESFPSPVDYK